MRDRGGEGKSPIGVKAQLWGGGGRRQDTRVLRAAILREGSSLQGKLASIAICATGGTFCTLRSMLVSRDLSQLPQVEDTEASDTHEDDPTNRCHQVWGELG